MKYDGEAYKSGHYLLKPRLQLHCFEESCESKMFFSSRNDSVLVSAEWTDAYLTYRCCNCGKGGKRFSISIRLIDAEKCEAYKYGELPAFGPPIPARALRLIQPDKDLFLQGRGCEIHGLGIGAIAYYRRVVERQWTSLVDEILKVAVRTGSSEGVLQSLKAARDERQFSKAVKDLKEAIPPVLLTNGHNPLALLHRLLSEGIHEMTDQECLDLARNSRIVLFDLAEKLQLALKDDKELKEAVNKLSNTRSQKKSR